MKVPCQIFKNGVLHDAGMIEREPIHYLTGPITRVADGKIAVGYARIPPTAANAQAGPMTNRLEVPAIKPKVAVALTLQEWASFRGASLQRYRKLFPNKKFTELARLLPDILSDESRPRRRTRKTVAD